MKWYRDLFLGQQARRRADEIMRDADEGTFAPDLYLITPAPNGIDQLNLHCMDRFFGKREVLRYMPEVVGIAIGRDEALEVLAGIARTVFREQGDGDLKRYFRERLCNTGEDTA